MLKFSLCLLLVCSAFAQDVEHVFRLAHTFQGQDVEEIAMALRTVSKLQPLIDDSARTIAVKGTASDIAMAEWLIPHLDVYAPVHFGAYKFRVAENPDDLVLSYAFKQRDMPLRSFQEVITTLRTVGSIRRIVGLHDPEIVVIRGNYSDVTSAEFLLSELDVRRAKREIGEKIRFDIPDGNPVIGDTLSVYRMAHASGNVDLQEIIAVLRTVIPIGTIYPVIASDTCALRGTVEELDVADWLISQLDRASPSSEVSQMPAPRERSEQIRVFHLAHVAGGKEINQLMKSIREQTGIKSSYYTTRVAAIAFRGTPAALDQAQQIVKTADASPTP